jgi:hypothetical protein
LNICGFIFYKYVVPDGTIEFMCEHDSINMLSLTGQLNLCGNMIL